MSSESDSSLESWRLFPRAGNKIFEDKKGPLTYCLRPCPIKSKVKELINKHGGFCLQNKYVVKNEDRDKVIQLVENEDIIFDGNAYHVDYIFKCVESKRLLPLEPFKIKPKVIASGKKYGRNEYTTVEDECILSCVENNETGFSITGTRFWKRTLKQNDILKRNRRTWQSIRDRYLKTLRKRNKKSNIKSSSQSFATLNAESPGYKTKRTHNSHVLSTESCLEEKNSTEGDKVQSENQHYYKVIDDAIAEIMKGTYTPPITHKEAYKLYFKCNGNKETVLQCLKNAKCPEGHFMLTDEEDIHIIKLLKNKEKNQIKKLYRKYNEEFVIKRCACLVDVAMEDMIEFSKINLPLSYS